MESVVTYSIKFKEKILENPIIVTFLALSFKSVNGVKLYSDCMDISFV